MPKTGTTTCPNCGSEASYYTYPRQERWYCLAKKGGCGRQGAARRGKPYATGSISPCVECGEPTAAQRKLCKRCKATRGSTPVTITTCAYCNDLFVHRTNPKKPRKYCGQRCKALDYRARRIERDKQQGRKRRKTFPRDQLLRLCYRDAYRCHICHKLVDLSYGPTHPKYPTADHLIPHADGGTDEWHNLALAHHECNSLRQNTGPAQLLIALGAR